MVCVSLCLSVRLSLAVIALQATKQLMGDTNSFCATRERKKCAEFAETTALERYGVKTSEKANVHNEHWLTSTRFSQFSPLWINWVQRGYVSKSSAKYALAYIDQI